MKNGRSRDFLFEICGEKAMFATPDSHKSCELISYPFPTYSAIEGMCNHLYFCKGMRWIPDEVRVMNRIRYVNEGIKTPNYSSVILGSSVRSREIGMFVYSYLSDVRYQIKAHYVLEEQYADNPKESFGFVHDDAINHQIKVGGQKNISMGKGVCNFAIIRPCEFGEGPGYYDDILLKEEYMFKRFDYYFDIEGKRKIRNVIFSNIEMRNGVIRFDEGAECFWRWED